VVSCVGAAFACASPAAASTVAYSGDASTVIVTGGDSANHNIQFRLSADAAHDEIIDTAGFTLIPVDCTVINSPTWISCPAHTNVQLDLGAGNDDVTFGGSNFDCFNVYTLNLGDGDNTLHLYDACPTAPAETATVTSGSGADTLSIGNQSASTVTAGDGADFVSGGSGNDVLHGGEGNDRVYGGAGNDQALGEGGADAMKGGAGNDLLNGGDGNDNLEYCDSCAFGSDDTGAGADVYVGGPGADTLWLDEHPGGQTITLDGVANDGSPGENDNVGTDIESLLGSGGTDTITGSAGPDIISGGLGNDEIHGGGGNDDLTGSDGDDKVYGDAGDDKVQGSTGADTVDGGPGADAIYGDIAACSFSCTADPDIILARDGEKDTVDCGGGPDSATVDYEDIASFCASVDRSPAPTPTPTPTPTPDPTPTPTPDPALALGLGTTGKLRISRPLHVVVTCSAACDFRASVVLSATQAKRFGWPRRTRTIGTVHGALLAAGKKTVTLRLSSAARTHLGTAGAVPATLRLRATDAAHRAATRSRAITLRR